MNNKEISAIVADSELLCVIVMRILMIIFLGIVASVSNCTNRAMNTIEELDNFNSINLKLVVLNELIHLGYFKQEIDSVKKNYWRWDNYTHKPIPEILQFIKSVKIEKEHEEAIRTITFDGGNEIYHLLIPNWDGEDHQFDVTDISDLERLKNLEEIVVISMVYAKDYSVLTKLDNLRRIVHWDELLKHQEVVNQLQQKGIVVR